MSKKTLTDLNISGKKVLVRVDFNVPIEQGIEAISDYDQRLRATLPTIQYLINQDCKIILCSHLGRPGGSVKEELRLAPVGDRLANLLGMPVLNLADCVGPEIESAIDAMASKDIILLENLRFHPEEEKNDPIFAEQLASMVDLFIMDAFAVAHRAHASTVGINEFLPSAMGLLVQQEIESMSQALDSPEPPFAALLGGAKVSDKILVLENILNKLDHLFIGGGMSVTFLNSQGYSTGASNIEKDRIDFARDLLDRARSTNISVHLPEDVIVANAFSPNPSDIQTVSISDVPAGWYIMDIGKKSAEIFSRALAESKTIIWNGPMGVFEMPKFSNGTRIVATAIGDLTGSTTVVGGGSTAEAVEALGLMGKMSHVSTGGGASLEFLEGKDLPGISALPDA